MALARVRKQVLVVDDDAEWRSSVAEMLDETCDVVCASDGEEGLRMARRFKPAAIVLDVLMPGGRDGLTVFSELRKDPETWHIPVLIVSSVNKSTGLGMRGEDIKRYLGCAPEGFIEKPANAAFLKQEVARLLAKGVPARSEGA